MSLPDTGLQKVSAEHQMTAAADSTDVADSDHVQRPKVTGPGAQVDLPRATWLQKHLLLSVLHLHWKVRRHRGRIAMLTKNMCVKCGSFTDLVEAQNMMYIAKHTTIPVPKVHLAFRHQGCTYILMERIHGHCFGRGWLERSPASKLKLLESLKGMILEMRALQKPDSDNLICSVNGGSLYDPRMPRVTVRYGPFKDVREFTTICEMAYKLKAARRESFGHSSICTIRNGMLRLSLMAT